MPNFVCHFAVYADDLERAKRFYRDAFGWSFRPWGPPDCYLIETGAASDAGITEGILTRRASSQRAGGLNAYRCTISVASIDITIEAIERAGGKLRSALTQIPDLGKLVEFEDTEGNLVCAMEYVPSDRRCAAPPRASR